MYFFKRLGKIHAADPAVVVVIKDILVDVIHPSIPVRQVVEHEDVQHAAVELFCIWDALELV